MDEERTAFVGGHQTEKQGCCGITCCPKSRGNTIVILRAGNEDIMLGPHYIMLMCTYVIVVGLSTVIYGVVLNQREEGERIAGLVLTILVILSLTVLALKDPGVAPISSEPVGEMSTFCEKCQSYRVRGTIHCNDCDVCVEDYDHHCPWSSKCIGKRNVAWFHLFLGLLFILMVYDGVQTVLVLVEEG